MRRAVARSVAAAAVAALAAGCGSEAPPPGADMAVADLASAGPPTPQAFDLALAQTFCGYDVRCGSRGASEQAKCEQDAAPLRATYPPGYSLADAVAAGRLAYDPAAAQACVDAWAKAGCTVDQQILANTACDGVFTPAVAPGGACRWDGECVGGWCDGSLEAGCAGTCKALLVEGAACDPSDDRCAGADFCHPDAKTCTARAGLGAACSPSARCQHGLFCLSDPAPDGGAPDAGAPPATCRAPGQVGDGCAVFFFGNDTCTPELYCDDSVAAPVCRARVGAGASCPSFAACRDGLDCVGLSSQAPGRCSPNLDLGAACDPSLDESGCPLDTRCDAAAKKCLARGNPGDDCSADFYCRPHAYCDDTDRCAATVPFGAACAPPPPNGAEPCDEGACDPSSMKCALTCA